MERCREANERLEQDLNEERLQHDRVKASLEMVQLTANELEKVHNTKRILEISAVQVTGTVDPRLSGLQLSGLSIIRTLSCPRDAHMRIRRGRGR